MSWNVWKPVSEQSVGPQAHKWLRLRHLALLIAALFAVACADAAGTADDDDAGESDMRVPIEGDDAGVVVPMPDMGMVVIPPGDRELQPVGDVGRLVFHSQTGDFGVRYLDPNGRPIPGSLVTMAQIDEQGEDKTAQGIEGSILQANRKQTDAMGVATFRLQAGQRDTTFTLEANAMDANPVRFQVVVGREGAGGLAIRATYDLESQRYQYADIQEVAVELYGCPEDEQGCTPPPPCATQRGLAEDQALIGPWLGLAPISPYNGGNDSTAVGDLPDGATFNVVALAKGEGGGNIAFGCAEATIRGGESPQVEIVMTDLPFRFIKDPYRIVSSFDFTDLLANSGNEALETVDTVLGILQILGDPEERADALIELVCNELINADEGICRIVESIGGPLLERLIDRFAVQLEPVFNVLGIISDLITIAENMTVVGEFEIVNPDGPEFLENDHRWDTFRFTWDGETRDVNLGPENAGGRNRTIAGAFDAEIDGNRVHILSHSLEFRYGLILLGIAEEWLIPAALGQQGRVSLEEAFNELLGGVCESINDFLFDDPQDGFCEDILIGALTEIITDQIGNLVFDGEAFTLSGVADLHDIDGDLRVDELRSGVWTGVISGLPMRGCFEACHEAGCMPNPCVIAPDAE